MSTFVICQMALCGEGLLASLEVADIWLLACMDAHVCFQVSFLSKPLITNVTFVICLSRLMVSTLHEF